MATEQSSYHRKRGREEDVSKLVDSGSKRTRQGSLSDAKFSESPSNTVVQAPLGRQTVGHNTEKVSVPIAHQKNI